MQYCHVINERHVSLRRRTSHVTHSLRGRNARYVVGGRKVARDTKYAPATECHTPQRISGDSYICVTFRSLSNQLIHQTQVPHLTRVCEFFIVNQFVMIIFDTVIKYFYFYFTWWRVPSVRVGGPRQIATWTRHVSWSAALV